MAWQSVIFGILALVSAMPAFGADAALDPSLSGDVVVQNLSVKDDAVSGTLINRSKHPVSEVRLQINYTWMWNDERHPGENSPGRTEQYTLSTQILPGGSAPFTYRPASPLPTRSDGHFVPAVNVVGATQVVPAGE